MYTSIQIADRIKSRTKSLGVQLKDILEQSELNRNMMASLKRGSMPKADNLAKIAEQLDCSVDYLLGLTDDPQPTDAAIRLAGQNQILCAYEAADEGIKASVRKLLDLE